MAENSTQTVDMTQVLKLKDIAAYQEHSVVGGKSSKSRRG
jgi:hypothetical protein